MVDQNDLPPKLSEKDVDSQSSMIPDHLHSSAQATAGAEGTLAPPPQDFSKIYEEHGRQVYYVALRMLGDPAQAEDATHDVFVKVYRNLDRFRVNRSRKLSESDRQFVIEATQPVNFEFHFIFICNQSSGKPQRNWQSQRE